MPNLTKNENKDISDFMLSEYEHISNAHFETSKQIISFYRYYLLIISAPTALLLFFDKEPQKLEQIISGGATEINYFTFILFLTIAVLGFLMQIYLTDKKKTSILYARVVNGIRKYFKEKNSEDISNFLVLKTDTKFPKYSNGGFLAIVSSIALLDSIFLFFAFWTISLKCLSIIFAIVFLIAHFLMYYYQTNERPQLNQ
jgi:hypothetical protein